MERYKEDEGNYAKLKIFNAMYESLIIKVSELD